MVWPILISLSVTPGAFCAAADIAMAPLSSNEPNNIRNTARSRSRTAGCCALTASCELAAAPPTRLTKSHRFIPSPRRQSGGAGGRPAVPTTQASLSHFFMKLFLAAPESFLPSELTAFGAHASRLHFFRKLLRAAPASGLPFLPTALLAHVSCAMAGPIAKAAIMAAKTIRFMGLPPLVHLSSIAKIAAPNSRNFRLTAPAPPLQVQRLARSGTAGKRRGAPGSCRRLPIRRALFDERPQSFLSVGGRSDVAEILHRLANAAPVIEIVDPHESSAPQPHRCSRLRRKNTGHCPCFVPHPLVRHDPADEAEGESFLGAEGAAAEQKLEGAMTADNARQMHKMNCWNEAEIDFRITKRRVFPGNQHVAGDGQRHAATPRRAADGGDRRLAEIVLYIGQFHVELVQQSPHVGCRRAEHQAQVQPRAESTRHRARRGDGGPVGAGPGPPQRRYELLEQ